MEKMTLHIPENTVEMLHLLAREAGQNIGDVIHEMALDRYMRHALNATESGGNLQQDATRNAIHHG